MQSSTTGPRDRISVDDPRSSDIRELLERHFAHAREHTAPDEIYALDADRLSDPAVTFFSLRRDGELLGVAALKHLDDRHAEIKSMHTVEAARRGGIGRALVEHLIAVAGERGYRRLSLETGSGPGFAAARALYADAGFEPCGPFGQYPPSPNSAFMALELESPRETAGRSSWSAAATGPRAPGRAGSNRESGSTAGMSTADGSRSATDDEPVAADAPGEEAVEPAKVPRGGWRDRMRSKPGIGILYRVAVFLVGLAFIGLGFALAVFPGPLTIPPVLLGLWIWSTEFRFAQKLFNRFREKARAAWDHAKRHPVLDATITVGGLVGAGIAFWAVAHFKLIDRARELVGI